ncbi:MAG TPA: hypothetical protein VIL13_08140 [Longimicrobiales bacterium]
MTALAVLSLTLRDRRRRLLALIAFAALFLAAGLTARLLVGRGDHGEVDFNQLFLVGGYPLVSGLLLLGWLLGRYALITTLVLMAGIVSHDRSAGYARLYAVRPVSPIRFYAFRFLVLGALAFLLSAALMPAFDFIMLGTWAGPATLVLILAYVLAYGSLTTLLSVWTRADAWITLLLAIVAMVWDALRRAGLLVMPPGVREVITFVLPPQAALLRLEEAFADVQPIPWDAFAYVAGYGAVMLILAGISLLRREL